MRRWVQRSLVNRFLFLYLIGTLIPVLCVGSLAYRISYDVVYDMSDRLMRDELKIAAVAIEDKTNSVKLLSAQMTIKKDFHDQLRTDCRTELIEWYYASKEFFQQLSGTLVSMADVSGCLLLGDGGGYVSYGETAGVHGFFAEDVRQLRQYENQQMFFLQIPKTTEKANEYVML